MKTIITLALVSIIGIVSLSANEEKLNKELEARITANKKLTLEYIKGAEESKLKDKIVPIEKESGDNWTQYLEYVLKSNDLKLKKLVLRNEYTQELIDAYYDLEYEEKEPMKILLRAKIANYNTKLEELKGMAEEDKAEPAKGKGDK